MDNIEELKNEIKGLKHKNFILEQSLKQNYSIQNLLENANEKLKDLTKNS